MRRLTERYIFNSKTAATSRGGGRLAFQGLNIPQRLLTLNNSRDTSSEMIE